jgi:hypothetical protein
MSESEKTKGLAGACGARARPKRPYHKPAVRYEQVFETRALSCGKIQVTQYGCHQNRRNS